MWGIDVSSSGRWYWYQCGTAWCFWAGMRYRNVKVCPKCRGPLKRMRPVTEEELTQENSHEPQRKPPA
jgi:hypothetical protein